MEIIFTIKTHDRRSTTVKFYEHDNLYIKFFKRFIKISFPTTLMKAYIFDDAKEIYVKLVSDGAILERKKFNIKSTNVSISDEIIRGDSIYSVDVTSVTLEGVEV